MVPRFDRVKCVSFLRTIFSFSTAPLYLSVWLTRKSTTADSPHESSCQQSLELETARPHSTHCHKCHGSRTRRSQLVCCLSNHCWINLTVVRSVESIERDAQRPDNTLFSPYTLTPHTFLIVLCICSRWGSTSQTCMRTWGMDITSSPCLRSSLELPWYEYYSLSYSHKLMNIINIF